MITAMMDETYRHLAPGGMYSHAVETLYAETQDKVTKRPMETLKVWGTNVSIVILSQIAIVVVIM